MKKTATKEAGDIDLDVSVRLKQKIRVPVAAVDWLSQHTLELQVDDLRNPMREHWQPFCCYIPKLFDPDDVELEDCSCWIAAIGVNAQEAVTAYLRRISGECLIWTDGEFTDELVVPEFFTKEKVV